MTTQVIITSPRPNHHKVGVEVVYAGVDPTGPTVTLDDGESTIVYVHDSAQIKITEVKKDA